MKRIFRRPLLIASTLVFVLSVFTNLALPYATAQAAVEDPGGKMDQQTERWFYYRGMWACLYGGLHSSLTVSDVDAGKWDPNNDKKSFGYFAPDMDTGDNDGTVSCDDGSIFARAPGVFGFDSPIELFCALDKKADSMGWKDAIVPNDADCESGATEFQRNGISNQLNQALTAILTDKLGADRPKFEIQSNPNSSAMYYWIGKKSLEIFCGGGTSIADADPELSPSGDDYVSVDSVDTSTGKITTSLTYALDNGRNNSDTVDDVIYNQGGSSQDAQDQRCDWMSEQTRKHSDSFSEYVIDEYNAGLAQDFKDNFTVSDQLKKKECGKSPSQACINILIARFNKAVDICKSDAVLQDDMAIEDRTEKMKECLKKELPKSFFKDVDKLKAPEVENQDEEAQSEVSETTCAIDGIGWIVCPVMTFMGKLNDAAFKLISGFLIVEPKLLTDPETESAWKSFRDLANAAFVIAFLIILYSQMSGSGISNYGIKKLLPKLIIAAVLVNISYYICQIAVDLSNIVGGSVYSFFKDVPTATDATSDFSGGLSWEKVIGYAIAVTAAVLVAILLAFTLGTAALLAFAMTVIILVARKAALVLLVVVSPLAFVAYLLPNTEDWFKKWWKMFSTLLMVFPVVGVIFGASTLAARIINNSSGAPDDSTILLQLTALGIMAVPLFAVPIVLKGAMAAAGSIGNKLSGLQTKANAGAMNAAKNGRAGDIGRAYKRRQAENNFRSRTGDGLLSRTGSKLGESKFRALRGVGKVAKGGARIAPSALGAKLDQTGLGGKLGLDKGSDRAYDAANKLDEDEVDQAADKLFTQGGGIAGIRKQLDEALQSGDSVRARGAMKALKKHGSSGINEVQRAMAKNTASLAKHSDMANDIRSHINGNKDDYKHADARLTQWAKKRDKDPTDLAAQNAALTTTDATELEDQHIAAQTAESLTTAGVAKETAERILDSDQLSKSIRGDKAREVLHKAANRPWPPI